MVNLLKQMANPLKKQLVNPFNNKMADPLKQNGVSPPHRLEFCQVEQQQLAVEQGRRS